MNEERYQELLGRLLDDELDAAQAGELAEWLRANPVARSDVRRNLFLWELYSQQRRSERSADAFAEACKTRILAEGDEHTFVEGVEARLRQAGAVASAAADRAASSFAGRLRRLLFSLRWVMSGAVAVSIVALCIWLFPATNNEPTLAVATGSRVTLERNGQSFPAQDGLKLLPGDLLRISGSNGAAIGYGKENTRVALNDDTELKILAWRKGKRLELRQGKLEAVVARQRPFGPMVLLAMQAEARVLGTKFTLAAATNSTRLEVSEGKVKLTLTSGRAAVKVGAGEYAVVADGTELKALPQTGSLLRENWTGIPGESVRDLLYHPDYPTRPAARDFVKSFETDEVRTNDFGCRLAGYIHAPVTGKYTFWIAAAADGMLWLSPNENPAEKVRIATDPGKISMPQSPPITLVAGRRYFIQAVQKTARGSSHLSVAWQPPGGEREVISGEFLSAFKPNN